MFKTVAKGSLQEKINATMISVSKIMQNPFQPRKRFDEQALMELSDSIKNFGVLQPLLVRSKGYEYELIAGERRLRAAIMCGLREVPCVVLNMEDERSAIVALVENLQRKDLDCFEEAEGIKRLIDMHGFTQEEVARHIGKSQSCVANKLRILRIDNRLRKKMSSAGLSERHARAILAINDDNIKEMAINKIIYSNFNVEQTENYIKKILKGEKKNNKGVKPIKLFFKDTRIFSNTINNALKVMQDSGIEAISRKRENDEYIVYLLRISKKPIK